MSPHWTSSSRDVKGLYFSDGMQIYGCLDPPAPPIFVTKNPCWPCPLSILCHAKSHCVCPPPRNFIKKNYIKM